MLFTQEQLREIRDIIEKHHTAFIISAMGEAAVDPETVKKLKELGIVQPEIDSIKESYLYGHLLSQLETQKAVKMSYSEFKQYIKKKPIVLSPIEQQAATFAQERAGQYCRGLGNRIDTQTGQVLINADRELAVRLEEEIKTATEENIARRETAKQLKTDLGWSMGDWERDLDRVAVTEKQTALNEGLADQYRSEYGADVLVAKIAMPDACDHCRRLHTGDDGQPRIFKLSELEANGTNVGRKAVDWKSVIGAIHPNCACQMIRIPDGWGFDEQGDLVPGGELGERSFEKSYGHNADGYPLQDRYDFQGLPLCIENKKGSIRKHSDGETEMRHDYGYIDGVNGDDNDEVDVFVGDNRDSDLVVVVSQQNPETGQYDETKCMLGFDDEESAIEAYYQHYDSPDFYAYSLAMDMDQFKRWLQGSMQKSAIPKDYVYAKDGDRGPSVGIGANFFIPTPKWDRKTEINKNAKELVEGEEDEGIKPSNKRDKAIYFFRKPLRLLREIILTDDFGKQQKEARKEAKENRKFVLRNKRKNLENKPY